MAIQRSKGAIMQKRYQESAEWKAIKDNQKKQMDNIINEQWLEGLQEIRQINAEHQEEENDEVRAPSRSKDFADVEPPSSGKIEKQK